MVLTTLPPITYENKLFISSKDKVKVFIDILQDKINSVKYYILEGTHRVRTHAALLYPNPNPDLSTPKPCQF